MKHIGHLIFVALISCSMLNQAVNKSSQKVLIRDSKGRVLKTFDGKVYRVYDTLGRRLESWGNPKEPDFDIYFRSIVIHTDTTIFEKEFWLGQDNKACLIKDSLDYNGHYYKFDKYGNFVFKEYSVSLTDSLGKVIGRKVTDKGNTINFDVKRFYSLPASIK